MSVEIGGFRIRVGVAAAAFLACLINYGGARLFLAGMLAAALHELTHLFLMLCFGCRHAVLELFPGGVRIRSQEFEAMGYRQTAVCLLGAPAVNLFFGALLIRFGRIALSVLVLRAALVNLSLGAVNLLPMSFLDGGRALECLLLSHGDLPEARSVANAADAVCLLLIAATIIVLSFLKIFPLSLYGFFVYCLAAVWTNKKKIDFF